MPEFISKADALAVARYGRDVVDGIEQLPGIEIVRCKDCRYWQDNNGGYPHEECRWGKGETPDHEDFCSYGEPKESNE